MLNYLAHLLTGRRRIRSLPLLLLVLKPKSHAFVVEDDCHRSGHGEFGCSGGKLEVRDGVVLLKHVRYVDVLSNVIIGIIVIMQASLEEEEDPFDACLVGDLLEGNF